MKHILRNLFIALLPLIAGIGLYLILNARNRPVPPPVLAFHMDLGLGLLMVGALLSLVAVVGVAGWTVASIRAEKRRKAEMAAEQNSEEESRRRFVRQLDHALKNPLTGLRAALTNLSVDTRGVGSAANGTSDALADAHHQVNRLSRLVGELRKLAELEERPLEADPVKIADLLAETVDAVVALPQYEGRRVSYNVARVPWPLPAITGDGDLLSLAFYNLIENALKYTTAEDAVEVRATEDRPWVVIEIADSGPGIAEEDIPRVFDELYRGANARGQEGSGLGLSLVKRVIERHGGDIAVRSRLADGRGTVFRVRLPMK